MRGWVRTIAAMTLALVAVTACTTARQSEPGPIVEQSDIHERLSEMISRSGFAHGLQSQRDGIDHFDAISIRLSLDSLKGRHLSLEKLMKDIGRICAHPNYAYLPIQIDIRAGEEEDQMYLYAILATMVGERGNINVLTTTKLRAEIIVTVRHPGLMGK